MLFVIGFRARTLERVRRAERLALACVVITLLASALLVTCFFVLFVDRPVIAAAVIALPALLPVAGWLGLWRRRLAWSSA